MPDNITQNISTELYCYMCNHIVGTEDHVKQIRLLNAVRDNLKFNEKVTTITSGSFGEGLQMRGSDLDIMYVFRNVEVYDVKPRFHPNISYLSMDTDDVKPGYTKLRLEYMSLFNDLERFRDDRYLSNTSWKQRFTNKSKNLSIHGPCISDRGGIYDYCFCLHCKTWVPPAVQWITRSNNAWPSYDVKRNQVSNFSASMQYFNMEQNRSFINTVEKTTNSCLLYFANAEFFVGTCSTFSQRSLFGRIIHMFFKMNNKLLDSSVKRGIEKTISCNQSSITYLYTYYMSMICSIRAQSIPLNSAYSNNKYQYRQYKSCLCTLLQNIYHDAVSGWLMLASFFYKTKQYAKSLSIIKYSISKCTFEKLFVSIDMSDIHHQLLKLKSLQKKSIVQLWKLFFVDHIRFNDYSVLIPDELLKEVDDRQIAIPSTAYAYFLNFLCHYHLNNVRQYQDTLQELQLVIDEKYLIGDMRVIDMAYNLLCVVFQLLGDTESASQAFSQSDEY
ncbi:unnamed protein product [Mytilus coruscus]|uniref:Uncharacterized protein n=1 Tax=Mytilus coruscus TaxID=42192 RepID=A0A6J8BC53_MYTCO|nr:unnamed protein product [Mytilus coruscus]